MWHCTCKELNNGVRREACPLLEALSALETVLSGFEAIELPFCVFVRAKSPQAAMLRNVWHHMPQASVVPFTLLEERAVEAMLNEGERRCRALQFNHGLEAFCGRGAPCAGPSRRRVGGLPVLVEGVTEARIQQDPRTTTPWNLLEQF